MTINHLKNKKNLIFVIISFLFIVFMVAFYGYRLIHYYRLENPKGSSLKANLNLASAIINKNQIVNSGNGLYFEDNNYIFKGTVDNNYLYYSGILWRIVKINQDQSIKIISEESLTNLFNDQAESLQKSILNIWMQDYLLPKLSHDEYLNTNPTCIDIVTNIDGKECQKYLNNEKLGFLSIDEYVNALGKKSYLNNGRSWWLSNQDDAQSRWYINNEGGISNANNNLSHGLRVTVTLKNSITSLSGDGTLSNPFIIEQDHYQTLADVKVGQYIKYSNYIWRIIDKDQSISKMVLDGVLDEKRAFSLNDNTFNSDSYNNIGYYLNNNFYQSLSNSEYIVSSNYFAGNYNLENNYDYRQTSNKTVVSKVGLLSIGNLFIDEYSNTVIMNPYNDEDIIYTIDDNYHLYGDMITKNMGIRPVIALDNTLKIQSGQGSKKAPWEISK